MPTLSFVVTQQVFNNVGPAITGFNTFMNPVNPIDTEDEFAKRGFLQFLNQQLRRLREERSAQLGDKLATCDEATWNQITGLLG
jgi:hypothetical protein